MNKRYKVIDSITEDDKQKIRDSLGEPHGNSIIKLGFNTNTLPHIMMEDDGLMHLFELSYTEADYKSLKALAEMIQAHSTNKGKIINYAISRLQDVADDEKLHTGIRTYCNVTIFQIQEDFKKILGPSNDLETGAIDVVIHVNEAAELYKEKATEELRKENDRLKSELLERDVTWLPAKDAEIERLTQSNKELVEALKTIIEVIMLNGMYNIAPVTIKDCLELIENNNSKP